MRPVLPRILPQSRNSMRQNAQLVAMYARGEGRTLMPFNGQGILSPSLPPNIRQQRGMRTDRTSVEVRGSSPSRYHKCYHVSPVSTNPEIEEAL